MTTSYLIDGKPGQGEDFVRAIDALPKDDLDFVCIQLPGKGEVSVLSAPDGIHVCDGRIDGSTWSSPVLTADQAKDLVSAFVEDRPYWRDGVQWELTSLPTREFWVRLLRLALIGAVLIALATWLTRVLAN